LDGDQGINKHVVVEGIAAKSEKHEVPPAGVGGRLRLKDDRNEEANVLDPPGLVVKLCHERVSRIVPEDSGMGGAAARRGGGVGSNVPWSGRDEEVLCLSDLAGQGIGCVTLSFPREGCSPNASLPLRGGSPSRDESSGEGGVRARRWSSGEGTGVATKKQRRQERMEAGLRWKNRGKDRGWLPGAEGSQRIG
jgi:hypothetical protein